MSEANQNEMKAILTSGKQFKDQKTGFHMPLPPYTNFQMEEFAAAGVTRH